MRQNEKAGRRRRGRGAAGGLREAAFARKQAEAVERQKRVAKRLAERQADADAKAAKAAAAAASAPAPAVPPAN
jgi:hypothetical protein